MKCRLSTDAVTQGRRACRMAAIAAARSTRCITFPPRTLPSPLASLGSASSEYSEIDSRTGFPCIVCSGVFAPAEALRVGHRLAGQKTFGRSRERAGGGRILQGAVSERVMVPLDHVVDADRVAGLARDRKPHRVRAV